VAGGIQQNMGLARSPLSLSFLLASGQAKGKGSDLDGVRGMFLDSADYEFLIGT
jgi:hypothetical protein